MDQCRSVGGLGHGPVPVCGLLGAITTFPPPGSSSSPSSSTTTPFPLCGHTTQPMSYGEEVEGGETSRGQEVIQCKDGKLRPLPGWRSGCIQLGKKVLWLHQVEIMTSLPCLSTLFNRKNTLYSMRKIQDVLWASERPSVATTEDSRDHCSSIDYYSDPPLSEGSNRYGMCMHTLVQAG